MSSGLIPISTKVGDAENIMGTSGILIKPKDVMGLKNAIDKLLIMEKSGYEEEKKKARDQIISNFSLSEMLTSYKKIYLELMDR